MLTRTVATTVAVAVLFLASCSSAEADLTDLAKNTCAELEGSIVLQVGGILSRAISDADDLGFTGPELGDKMREECPGIMAAIDNIGDEQEARDALPSQMRVSTSICNKDGAAGTVKNTSDITVDVWISVQYLNSSGTIIEDGLDSVDRIRPGETANWEDKHYSSISGMQKCRAEISSVFES